MKQICTLLFSVAISFASNAENILLDGLNYNLDPNTNTAEVVTLPGSNGVNYPELEGSVSVPSAINVNDVGYTVTAVGASAFSGCEGIVSVILPSTVQSIGNYAFSDCINMHEITLPATVSNIGTGAFSGSSIKEVELNGDVKIIKSLSFAGTELESVKLPQSVEIIEDKAFSGCNKLRNVTLGDCLVSIGNSSFERCKALESIVFPETLKTIGARAFKGCISLSKIDLKGVSSVGDEAFEICSSLADIDFGEGKLKIGYSAFAECVSLTLLSFPQSVDEIGQYAFYNCIGLKSVSFEDGGGALTLGHAPFANAPFTDLYVGRDVTTSSSNDNVFSSNKNLSKLVFGDAVTFIAPRLFSYISSLEEVTFGSRISEVGYDAFSSCPVLTKVKCCSAADWAKIDFEDATANPLSYGAELYIDGQPLSILDLADGTTHIGSNSFAGYRRLTEIVLPASLRHIGNQAFMDCFNISKVTMHGGVAEIGARAFLNCRSIAEVNVPSLSSWLKNGFETAYSNPIAYDAKLYADGILVEDVDVPAGIDAIGDFAFVNYGKVKRLYVPDGVKAIGRYAFADCSFLAAIDLGADIASIGNRAFNGAPISVITLRNPQPPVFATASTTATFSNYSATLFVPEESLKDYSENSSWRLFSDIRGQKFSGIQNPVTSDEIPFDISGSIITAKTACITVNDINGTVRGQLNAGESNYLESGIYIVTCGKSSYKLFIR